GMALDHTTELVFPLLYNQTQYNTCRSYTHALDIWHLFHPKYERSVCAKQLRVIYRLYQSARMVNSGRFHHLKHKYGDWSGNSYRYGRFENSPDQSRSLQYSRCTLGMFELALIDYAILLAQLTGLSSICPPTAHYSIG